jgi:hypothetical protein
MGAFADGLYAAPEDRLPFTGLSRAEAKANTMGAAGAVATLLSPALRRLGKFLSPKARTVHAGVKAMAERAALGLADARVAGGTSRLVAGVARKAPGAAWGLLDRHARRMVGAARHGIGDALKRASALNGPKIPSAWSVRLGTLAVGAFAEASKPLWPTPWDDFKPGPGLRRNDGHPAFRAFVSAERRVRGARGEGAPRPLPPDGTSDMASRCAEMRRAATGLAMGLFMTLKLSGQRLAEKHARVERFLSGGARTITAGARKAGRGVADAAAACTATPYARMATAALAVAALSMVGMGHFLPSPLDPAVAHVGDAAALGGAVSAKAAALQQFSFTEAAGAAGAKVSATGTLALDRAGDAYRAFVASASSLLGKTAPGQEIVAAAQHASQTHASAFTQVPDAAQAAAHADALHHAAAAHADALHHAAAARHGGPGLHRAAKSAADLLNAQELKILSSGAAAPRPLPEFADAARETFGHSFGGPEAAQRLLDQNVAAADGLRHVAGSATVTVTAPDGAKLLIDPTTDAMTILDKGGTVVAEQIGDVMASGPRAPGLR